MWAEVSERQVAGSKSEPKSFGGAEWSPGDSERLCGSTDRTGSDGCSTRRLPGEVTAGLGMWARDSSE
jgi:hypothetical protein